MYLVEVRVIAMTQEVELGLADLEQLFFELEDGGDAFLILASLIDQGHELVDGQVVDPSVAVAISPRQGEGPGRRQAVIAEGRLGTAVLAGQPSGGAEE